MADDFIPEKLSFEEIDHMIHSESVTFEQLDLLAGHTRRLNDEKRNEIAKLERQLNKIEARLASL